MKKRSGLSSIIGMVFFVIILASTLGYVTYTINLMGELNSAVIIKGAENVDKMKEDFEIVSAKIDGGKFNVTVQNTGPLSINFTRVWVNNVTDNSWPLTQYDVKKIATPGAVLSNIGQDLSLQVLDTQGYSMKLVTQRGNYKEFFTNSPSQEPLDLKFFALPQTIPNKFTTTLLLAVTNNMTKNNILLNIKPQMINIARTGASQETLISPLFPIEYSSLAKGDPAYFSWVYEITGTPGETITFTASLENAYPGNEVSTTVYLTEVLLAQQSGTSLTSSGLAGDTIGKDILIFHAETVQTPGGAYQMFSGDPDIAGATISVETDHPNFFTKNGTAVNIKPGNWNASLTYFSAPYPDSLMDNNDKNMIFHFEANTDPEDSTGNTNGHNLGSGSERPTHESTGGPHDSGAFRFDDNDYIELKKDQDNDIKKAPDTTSLWFKADDGVSDTQYLYHAGKDNQDNYYKIIIDTNDNVVFEYLTKKNETPAKCESSGFDYENGKWQHVVAVRPTDNTCKLYINATDVDLTPQNGNTQNGDVGVDKIFVGAEDDNPGDGFNGVIDDVLHWNDYALTAVEVSDLFNTNYGSAAHLVTFSLDKTDSDGIVLANIGQSVNYPLKFLDGKENAQFLDSFNYTKYIGNWANFTSTERLVFDMQFVNGLDIDLRIDDNTLTGNPATSFLQVPQPDADFLSYITIFANQQTTLSLVNSGPEDAWITFGGTRLVFGDVASSNTFASIILKVNNTDVNPTQDSIAFPVNSMVTMTFSEAQNPPSTGCCTGLITAGDYKMKMHINGYDVKNSQFLKTIDFGTVKVV